MTMHFRVAVLASIMAAGASVAAPSPIQRVSRFSGTVRVGGKDVRVAIDTWLIPNALKVAALELPLRGQTVYELRGGTIVTVIDGRRQKRAAGELWAVSASAKTSFETEDDSAALQTTVVAE